MSFDLSNMNLFILWYINIHCTKSGLKRAKGEENDISRWWGVCPFWLRGETFSPQNVSCSNKNIHDGLWSKHKFHLTCPTNPISAGTVHISFFLAFALLFLFDGGAVCRRCWAHRWSTQFLCFGFFHFLLDGIDVQFTLCRSFDIVETEQNVSEISCESKNSIRKLGFGL